MNNEWVRIKYLNFYSVHVRAKTEWKFMEFISDDGLSGISEITDTQLQSSVSKIIAKLSNKLRDEKISSEENLIEMIPQEEFANTDLNYATAISGIRSAFLDLYSKRLQVSLSEYLAIKNKSLKQKKEIIRLYANINRSMLPDDNGPVDRSPDAFNRKAKEFEKKGFNTIKCAPFDECNSPFNRKDIIPEEAKIGLERISAISENLEKDTNLFVDCHSRFDLNSSYFLHDELKDRNVKWFEEPVDPEKNKEDMKKINSYSIIPTAGAEMVYGTKTFMGLIEEEIIDIVMPDVKFCGGPTEIINLDQRLEDSNKISMHCPSGPVSLLTSAQITSSINSKLPLEHAVDEVDWRHELLLPYEKINDGKFVLPNGNGVGASLNLEIINKKGKLWQE
ncbi:MAG: hypothetical protein CL773_05765 [Chloroflexi bacterium]|nr:hypothetical protein [Chloroflexota bacterium]|tara:strand:+ start:5751 stop:6926 length:1176 start_codon:yes stop_codon:yes gene_type:complete